MSWFNYWWQPTPEQIAKAKQKQLRKDPAWAPWDQYRLTEFKDVGIDKRKCQEKKKIKDYWKE